MSSDERGQSTVELALSLPLVVVVLAIVVQVGAVALDHVRLWHAAREAARVAAVDADVGTITRAAESSGVTPLDVKVEPQDLYRRQGEPVTVTVTHSPAVRIPVIGALVDGMQLRATASMRIEEP